MDANFDRNPSPPPELLESDMDLVPDKLGDSVFSKHWLFQTLIRIIETVNKGSSNSHSDVSSSSQQAESDMTRDQEMDIVELEPSLEEDACTLWDMSANRDVAGFLQEFKVAEIFLEVIEKTRSPRLLEIVVGILGNLVSFDELCTEVAKNNGLLSAVVRLSGSSDAPTVIQVLRLIHGGIVNKSTTRLWFGAIIADTSFMENLKFILENSLNGDVLKRGLQLLYYILDMEDQLCIEWGAERRARAIIESGKQLDSLSSFEAMDEFWMVMNLLCLHESNFSFLSAHFGEIYEMFYKYMRTFEDYEEILPPVDRITAVAAAVSASSTLLSFESKNRELFAKDNTFISFLYKMLKSVSAHIQLGGSSIPLDEASQQSTSAPFRTTVLPSSDATDSPLVDVSWSGAQGKKIPSYKTRATKTEADYSNLSVFRESLEELCATCRSFSDLAEG